MPDEEPQQPHAPAGTTRRLRHRVGLAAATVAGAGSLALGAGLAQAAPAAAAPGVVVADDPAQGEEDGTAWDTGSWAQDDSSEAADDGQSADEVSYSSDDSADEDSYSSDDASEDVSDDTADSADSADDQAGPRQGWDGSVYWFRNSSGEWRYTAHRDVYLNRVGSSGGSGSGSSGRHTTATAARGDVESAVEFALAQLGTPYVMGGNGPDGYDCSGLIQQSFRHAGIALPRIASDQYRASTPVGAGDLRRGDLLFWSYDGSVGGIHHAAIYLGNNKYVEAAHQGTNVRTATLNHGYWPTQMGRP
ncbi:C40 family peptidase [Streptomyces tateyamensis]|nr:C40 family peptidase [Streptomyces tateyamensis]